jgi:hypothetical protein
MIINAVELLEMGRCFDINDNETKDPHDVTHIQADNLNLTAIPKGFDVYPNLISLSLDQNFITELENLEKQYKLEILSIEDNQIGLIKGLDDLVSLTDLYLDNNFNIEFVDNIAHLPKLTTFTVSFVDIKYTTYQPSKVKFSTQITDSVDKGKNNDKYYFNEYNLERYVNLYKTNTSEENKYILNKFLKLFNEFDPVKLLNLTESNAGSLDSIVK